MISMCTDEGQSESAAGGNARVMSEVALQTPKRKRGRPRKIKDLENSATRCDLPPSGSAPYPLSFRTPEEETAYKSAPAASTHGPPHSDFQLHFRSCSLTPGLPAVYPEAAAHTKEQPCRESSVVKRGRGRPPKIQALNKKPTNPNGLGKNPQQEEKNPEGIRTPSNSDLDKGKKRSRGRPKGSGKFKKEVPEASEPRAGSASEVASVGATGAAQVLYINPGEDVARIVTSFCQKASRPMCLISGSGAVGYIELKHQFPSRGGSTVYQGIREILSVSGYFIPLDVGNERTWSCRFSVALADSGGAVIGGGVSGAMIAASKVQVIVKSFTDAETHMSQNSTQSVTQA